MSATALWFGPDERRLFGWVHCHDDGKDRPAVLLCPPLARELNSATFSYRLLAEALEREGFLAIRFDYDGTGDSAGSHQDPDRVESWVRSIQSAGDLARQCGASSVSLVGLRMGGLLADEAANRMDVEALVLWDPCKEGRSFVRQQQAIQLLATSDPENSESAVEIPGFVVDPDTLDDLSGLKLLRSAGARSLPTLILHRPDALAILELAERFSDRGTEAREITGQSEFLDVEPLNHVVPLATLDEMTTWLVQELRPPQVDVPLTRSTIGSPHAVASPSAVVGFAPDGPVIERVVSLGPLGLFGIETLPATPDPERPTLLMMNSGKDSHTGPGRLWVRMAREWASLGFRSIRFDFSGLGDSPVRDGQAYQVVRAPEAFDDLSDVVSAQSEDPTNVIFVGLCSGAYQAFESGLELMPRGILAINPLLAFKPPEMETGPIDPRRRICQPPSTTIRAYRRLLFPRLRRLLEPIAWRAARLLMPKRSPAKWLNELIDHEVDVYCVFGNGEVHQVLEGTKRAMPSLIASGRLHVEVISKLNHALIAADQREHVIGLFSEHLMTKFGPSCPPTTEARSKDSELDLAGVVMRGRVASPV